MALTARSGRGLEVLVVDDSAVVRQFMRQLLSNEPGMNVSTAADPVIAMGKMARKRPDVILLDLEMPRMSGLAFLHKLMREEPIPVVVCSSHADQGTESALRALDEGAVEVLAKPRVGIRGFLHESAVLLIDTLRAAAEARLPAGRRPSEPAPPPLRDPRPARSPLTAEKAGHRVVAVGASTGGPDALSILLAALPPDSPGVVIVQHMPEAFTRAFARRLDQLSPLEVREARDDERVVGGRALVARGDRHLRVVRVREGYAVRLDDGPLVSRHRPSIDVLFHSVAESAGADAIGVLMTGMGKDGAAGLLAMRRAGAATIAQDEESCVVFGMPREAIALGAAETVAPLSEIAPAICERAAAGSRSARVALQGAGR